MKQNSWLLGILLFLSPLQMSAQKQDTVARNSYSGID